MILIVLALVCKQSPSLTARNLAVIRREPDIDVHCTVQHDQKCTRLQQHSAQCTRLQQHQHSTRQHSAQYTAALSTVHSSTHYSARGCSSTQHSTQQHSAQYTAALSTVHSSTQHSTQQHSAQCARLQLQSGRTRYKDRKQCMYTACSAQHTAKLTHDDSPAAGSA